MKVKHTHSFRKMLRTAELVKKVMSKIVVNILHMYEILGKVIQISTAVNVDDLAV